MAKRKKSKKSMACKTGLVSFKTKRGKKISFKGHVGAGCPARKKPSTRHLDEYKTMLRAASKGCKGKARKPFLSCVRTQMKAEARHMR